MVRGNKLERLLLESILGWSIISDCSSTALRGTKLERLSLKIFFTGLLFPDFFILRKCCAEIG